MVKAAIICVVLFAVSVEGKRYEAVLVEDTNWLFLDKFVYDTSGDGIFRYNIQVLTFGRNTLDGEDVGDTNSYFCKCTAPTDDGQNVSCANAGVREADFQYTDCVLEDRPGAFLLFYNDVDGSENDWESIYKSRSRTTCDDRMKRAQQPIPLVMGQINSGQVDIAPASRARFWCNHTRPSLFPPFLPPSDFSLRLPPSSSLLRLAVPAR